jgi:hypothetical protein
MKKSTFVVPPEIRRLLGPAPVLSSEDPNRFEEMLNHFAQCYQPKNFLEWSRVWTQTVSGWKLQRLTRYDTQVQESLHKKVVEEAERARAKQAEEEHRQREFDRMFGGDERFRPTVWLAGAKTEEKTAATNPWLPSDSPILSGLPLRQAKQRLLSCILRKPHHGRYVQRHGITRDHFSDNPEWQEAFDMMRNGADIQAHVVKNPTSEIARLWQSADEMRAGKTLSLAYQIMASVRAEAAAASVTETAVKSSKAVEPEDGDQPQSDGMDVETISAKAEPTPQPETEKVTTETANKPVALTEVIAELDYASVLPQYTPLLLDLDRLRAAEQKRFDMVPAQMAFERGCLALNLQGAPSDLLEGEFTEMPTAGEVDQLPSTAHASAPVQSAIGSAPHQPPLIAVAGAVSSTVVAPVVALSSAVSVGLRVPDSQDDGSSEHLERARGQVPSTDENPGGRSLHRVSPPGMLQATEDELDSPAVSAAKAGAVPGDDTESFPEV